MLLKKETRAPKFRRMRSQFCRKADMILSKSEHHTSVFSSWWVQNLPPYCREDSSTKHCCRVQQPPVATGGGRCFYTTLPIAIIGHANTCVGCASLPSPATSIRTTPTTFGGDIPLAANCTRAGTIACTIVVHLPHLVRFTVIGCGWEDRHGHYCHHSDQTVWPPQRPHHTCNAMQCNELEGGRKRQRVR
jgi:hypothetical protein